MSDGLLSDHYALLALLITLLTTLFGIMTAAGIWYSLYFPDKWARREVKRWFGHFLSLYILLLLGVFGWTLTLVPSDTGEYEGRPYAARYISALADHMGMLLGEERYADDYVTHVDPNLTRPHSRTIAAKLIERAALEEDRGLDLALRLTKSDPDRQQFVQVAIDRIGDSGTLESLAAALRSIVDAELPPEIELAALQRVVAAGDGPGMRFRLALAGTQLEYDLGTDLRTHYEALLVTGRPATIATAFQEVLESDLSYGLRKELLNEAIDQAADPKQVWHLTVELFQLGLTTAERLHESLSAWLSNADLLELESIANTVLASGLAPEDLAELASEFNPAAEWFGHHAYLAGLRVARIPLLLNNLAVDDATDLETEVRLLSEARAQTQSAVIHANYFSAVKRLALRHYDCDGQARADEGLRYWIPRLEPDRQDGYLQTLRRRNCFRSSI